MLPAPDYLQSQRIRMMMMMKLAEATAHVDVYLGPGSGGGAGRWRTRRPGWRRCARERTGPGAESCVKGPGQRHSAMANLATYPAVAVPNGFNAAGTPTSITFFARPFGEIGAAGGGEGVSGRDRIPPEASHAGHVGTRDQGSGSGRIGDRGLSDP